MCMRAANERASACANRVCYMSHIIYTHSPHTHTNRHTHTRTYTHTHTLTHSLTHSHTHTHSVVVIADLREVNARLSRHVCVKLWHACACVRVCVCVCVMCVCHVCACVCACMRVCACACMHACVCVCVLQVFTISYQHWTDLCVIDCQSKQVLFYLIVHPMCICNSHGM